MSDHNEESFDNTNTSSNNNQFIVSYELLALLRWFIEHDSEKLKKMITKAYLSGLKDEMHRLQVQQDMSLDDIHFTIIEFLGLLDSMLMELTNEQMVLRAMQKNLIPTIEHIDSTIMDDETVRSSVQKATINSERHPSENPKITLYKELLKRWKPNKKMSVN